MEKFNLTITAASGIEGIVKKELSALGFSETKAIDGGINIQGTLFDIAKLNMFLRCADRVYLQLGQFKAETFDELFDGISSLPIVDFVPFNAKISVNGKTKKSKLFALSSCQSIVKKAILNSLSEKYHRSIFPESGETYQFEFTIINDVTTLFLNTSGCGLHKRGWRDLVGEAPLRETLACAMLSLSDISADNPFCDPFCGSGTIAIEGARKVLNIAPGRDRKFDYMFWDFIPPKAHSLSLEEALDNEQRNKSLRFYGFDINPKAISLSVRHAKKAGVGDKIHFQVQDAGDFKCRYKNGCIVTNPPYGERLSDLNGVASLYAKLGKVWRTLDNWSLYAITSANNFEKNFGTKSVKNRKLYNAEKECHFYMYPKPKQ